MDINIVKEKLNQVLYSPEEDSKFHAYISAYRMLLDEVRINSETANIAIKAVDLDHGVEFLEAYLALEKKETIEAWKTIRKCEELKNNTNNNGLKLISIFIASALSGEDNTASILGKLITAFSILIKNYKIDELPEDVIEVIKKFVLEMLPKEVKVMEWKAVKTSADNILVFCKAMFMVIALPEVLDNSKNYPAAFAMKKWISDGMNYAEQTIELDKEKRTNLLKKVLSCRNLLSIFNS